MFRKLFVILVVLLMAPAFANAWYVNAKTSPLSGQGTISPSGNITVSGTTGTYQDFNVTAATGYQIARVTVDSINTAPLSGTTYRVPYAAGKTWRYIVAYFAVKTVNITTQITAGSGVIREDTFESLTNIPAGSNRQLLVIPNPGYVIDTVVAANATSITDNPDGSKTVVYNNLQQNQAVSASFALVPVVTVSAGPDVTANGEGAEFATTLYGSATSNQGAITYAWTGDGLSFGSPGSAETTVYAATAGPYTATLTVTSGSIMRQDTAAVTVLSRTEYLEAQCTVCHADNTPQVVADYDASPHKTKSVSCQDCHTANTPHEYQASCIDCHSTGNSWGLPWPPPGKTFHNAYNSTDQCARCHGLHSTVFLTGGLPYPHFANSTTAAQYVNPNITCDNCHTSAVDSTFNVYSANLEWARSGKANPLSPAYMAEQFKSKGTAAPATPANSTADDCVRCHTTTGFVNYVNSNFTDIAPFGGTTGSREMVGCSACHNPTPFDANFSRRSIGIEAIQFNPGVKFVVAWYGYSSLATKKFIRPKSYENPSGANMNDSDICIVCHTGKFAGDLIKLSTNCSTTPSIVCRAGATGSFWQNVDFIDPHNMNTANIMLPDGIRAGYEYRVGVSSITYHTNIGLTGTQGPCVGCHMSSPKKHSYAAISTASNGVISAITTTLCNSCHGSIANPIDASILNTKKEGYNAAARGGDRPACSQGDILQCGHTPILLLHCHSRPADFCHQNGELGQQCSSRLQRCRHDGCRVQPEAPSAWFRLGA